MICLGFSLYITKSCHFNRGGKTLDVLYGAQEIQKTALGAVKMKNSIQDASKQLSLLPQQQSVTKLSECHHCQCWNSSVCAVKVKCRDVKQPLIQYKFRWEITSHSTRKLNLLYKSQKSFLCQLFQSPRTNTTDTVASFLARSQIEATNIVLRAQDLV